MAQLLNRTIKTARTHGLSADSPGNECQLAREIRLGVITVSTSLSSRNEPGNTGLHYGNKT
jgi:hypothetical protein